MRAKLRTLMCFCAGMGGCMPLAPHDVLHTSNVGPSPGAVAPAGGPSVASTPATPGSPGSAPATPGSPGSAPAGPVSVSIRSSCPKTVDVFFGKKPGFSSGTFSSIESSSVSDHSFQPGDMMWIVDGDQNGLASATVSPTTTEIEVTRSCTGLIMR